MRWANMKVRKDGYGQLIHGREGLERNGCQQSVG